MNLAEIAAQCVPPAVVLCVLLAVVQVVATKTTWLDGFETSAPARLPTLDGLRAFLAFGVVVCHIGTFYYFYRGIPWGPHPNPYYRQAGAASVRLFFMITGFLFWTKAINGNGVLQPAWLYRNRFFRIMPLYIALALVIVVISFAVNRGLVVSPERFLLQVAGLLVPGALPSGQVNGYGYGDILKQAWTLRWELEFYAVLPLIAWVSRSWRWFVVFGFCMLVLSYLVQKRLPIVLDLSVTANFLVGMAAAHLMRRYRTWDWCQTRAASVANAILVVAAPMVTDRVSIYLGNLLYAGIFVMVLYGNDLFGLLRLRASRLLGDASYSTYLLHMLVLVFGMQWLNEQMPISGLSHAAYWLAVSPAIPVLYVLSLLTYRYIERPWIARGRPRATVAPAPASPPITA